MASTEQTFKNVGVPAEDHSLLAQIANHEDRSMARQLAVMIRQKHRELFGSEASDGTAAGIVLRQEKKSSRP